MKRFRRVRGRLGGFRGGNGAVGLVTFLGRRLGASDGEPD
jgi:hypothetical protein